MATATQTHTWTLKELEALWIRAGGPKSRAKEAAAIALAESHGDPHVRDNVNKNGTRDRGLWQINSVHKKLWGSQLYDPLANARAAVSVFNSQGFKAWTTWRNGDFLKFMMGSSTRSRVGDIPFTPRQVGQAAGGVKSAVTGPVAGIENFILKESVVGLSYVTLVVAALAFFVIGAMRATGSSPADLARQRGGSGAIPY